MTPEANFQVKKEIDGIINDCLHILVRMRQLEDRYGIQLVVLPSFSTLWENDDGTYSQCDGGADFQVFRGGQELAGILNSPTKVDRALGDRRLRFRYRGCQFTQLATGSAIFRKSRRRNNRWTNAVNESVDEQENSML